MINAGKQAGYMDMQVMPAMIGVVVLLATLGLVSNPEFDLDNNLLLFSAFMLLGTAALLYGFAMHIYALGYPESPFNKHTSPALMTVLCGGPLIFAACRFYSAGIRPGLILYAILSLLVISVSAGFAIYRGKKRTPDES
jgi:hypothetical protein